jgi:hypothetical protein
LVVRSARHEHDTPDASGATVQTSMAQSDAQRLLAILQDEIDGIALYRALAEVESDPSRPSSGRTTVSSRMPVW